MAFPPLPPGGGMDPAGGMQPGAGMAVPPSMPPGPPGHTVRGKRHGARRHGKKSKKSGRKR